MAAAASFDGEPAFVAFLPLRMLPIVAASSRPGRPSARTPREVHAIAQRPMTVSKSA
jgi:hypothetical protein